MDGRIMIASPFKLPSDMPFLRHDNHIACYIHVDFRDIVYSTPEELMDLIEDKIIINGYIDGLEYRLAGSNPDTGTVQLMVDGYVMSYDD